MSECGDTEREARRDRFAEVLRQSHDAIVVFDPATDEVVDVNPRACTLLGYERDELVGRSPRELHPEEVDAFERFVERVLADGEGATESLSCRTRRGERVPSEVSAALVDYDGRDCVLATIHDVTERQQYIERLEALNSVGRELMAAESQRGVAETITEVSERLLDQPLTAVWADNGDGDTLVPVTASRQALDVVDGTLPVLGADSFEREVFAHGEARVVDYAEVTNPGLPGVSLRTTLLVPLGRHGVLSVGSMEPKPFDEGTRHLVEVLAQTATAALEHVEREEALRERTADLTRQNERLAEFASVVSHDLRNPLNVAQGYLEMLDTDETETRERIGAALDRMESLVGDVLTLARQGETVDEVERVELATVAEECWQTTVHADTTLSVSPSANRALFADEDRLRQTLENLFRNAVEHGEAGTVRVGVLDGVESGPTEANPGGDGNETADETRGFYVEDDGTGIPESVRDRLFEPGVSTDDDGTGFGLRIVETIAEAHGWTVSVGGGADGGARFEVRGVEWADGD